ncbi:MULTISPECIES: non-hydrolyzing UDP-N-acetylglucosamine 2-epimerase [unclassified Aeromicrobium]|uniref:non-hydrolyzing UDP-N-acetylglucosamine 2-epimerase n=1 Tax=unclassified Aeromicrobium TaxID=2633570 RepID=UPI00396B08CE
MKVLSIVGARPQFVKLAPIDHAFRAAGVEHVIVHTGQHYDERMSGEFFRELDIAEPDVNLEIGSAGHGAQTGAMLARMDDVILEHRPDWVLVYGDTNSTLAGAVSAVKLQVPLAHLEAGLRSFNRAMPEEHNRVLTDHAADLLLAPTEQAMAHLATEGLAERSVLVGDVMTDVLTGIKRRIDSGELEIPDLGVTAGEYHVSTIHRAENTDDPERLRAIVEGLQGLERPVVLLAHPRLVQRCADFGIVLEQGSVRVHEPLPYGRLVAAAAGAHSVITDSGGLQKEAFLLRVPCVTVRTETEWVETVELGWNVLASDPRTIAWALASLDPQPTDATPYGDGRAAQRVVEALSR